MCTFTLWSGYCRGYITKHSLWPLLEALLWSCGSLDIIRKGMFQSVCLQGVYKSGDTAPQSSQWRRYFQRSRRFGIEVQRRCQCHLPCCSIEYISSSHLGSPFTLLSGHFEGGPRSAAKRATVDWQRHCCLQVDSSQSGDKCNRGEAFLNSQKNQNMASI